uniref:Methyltransferase, FkbM family n=1 Tax=Candidatus Kentrum sp. FW TaxID=2126338 RepID=A0A450TAE7_9GAMM|nr:MAG: methyltransferase, FkbM family [Candidatus Kentron sp. FW]VFJ66391.1 MAG: methyltransferase, FkbM family [Candidatus Kentron sp. FW]
MPMNNHQQDSVTCITEEKGVVLCVQRNDVKYPFYLRFRLMDASDVQVYSQIFLQHEYRFTTIEPPKVILDAGANIGLSAIYFANRYPSGKIIALEPERNNFLLLQKNTAIYENIIGIQGALWHKNEMVGLLDSADIQSWAFRIDKANDKKEKIPAITVGDIIRKFHIDRINILKMDIEGAEREVLGNSKSWIDMVDSIIVESHESWLPGCDEVIDAISPYFSRRWQQGENIYLDNGYIKVNDKV